MIRWFRLPSLLDAAATADMLAWDKSGFSIDAHVRITLLDRDEPPPISRARGPPTDWGELVQTHDARDIFQASPEDFPLIDFRSL